MGNTSRSTMIFDAEGAKAIAELRKLAIAQKEVEKAMKDAARASVMGSQESQKELDRLAVQYVKNDKSVQQYRNSLKQLDVEQGNATRGLGRWNMMLGQGSYALDDFLTVLAMPGMGFIPAMRAASNNVSVMLASFNPLLAVVPAATTAFAALIPKLLETSDAQETLAKSSEVAIGRLREEIQASKELKDAQGELLSKSMQLGDEKFANEMGELRKRQQDVQQKRADFAATINAAFNRPELADNRKAAGIGDDASLKEKLEFLDSFAGGRAALSRMDKNRGFFGRDVAEAFRANERDALGLAQEENLIMQEREARERARKEAAEKEAGDKLKSQVEGKLGVFTPQLRKAAVAGLKEGLSEDEIAGRLGETVSGQFSAEEQEELQRQLSKIVEDAKVDRFKEQFEPKKKEKEKSPEQKRLDEISIEQQELNIRRQQIPFLGLRGKDERAALKEIEERQRRLQLEQSQLQLQIAKQANEPIIKEQETTNDILKDIRDALIVAPPAPPRTGREVARNP